MGQRWVDVEGDQVMDVEDEIADLSDLGAMMTRMIQRKSRR